MAPVNAPAAAPAEGTTTEATAEPAAGVAAEATAGSCCRTGRRRFAGRISCKRGVLRISTDPAYPPQSDSWPPPRRRPTKCTGEERTAVEFKGLTSTPRSRSPSVLGVEPCFVTPDWDADHRRQLVRPLGPEHWSMTITPERMEKLYFSQPYYTTPAAFFVHKDNTTFTQPSDLSGKKVGACAGCT